MKHQNHRETFRQSSKKNNATMRVIAILTCLALASGLTACSPFAFVDKGSGAIQDMFEKGEEKIEEVVGSDEEEEEDEEDNKKKPQKDEVPEEEEKAADASESESADEDDDEDEYWKVLYVRTLDYLREEIPGPDDDYGSNEYTPCEYYLYDIDKDGIPEMLLKRGTCEADYNGELYRNDGYAVRVAVYDIGMGHMGFYSDPGENGIIFNWGHMGGHSVERASLKKRDQWSYDLEYEGLLTEEITGEDEEYTEVSSLVPGAVSLPWSKMSSNLLVEKYEDIMAAMEGHLTLAKHDDSYDQVIKDAVEDTINNGGAVVGISASGYSRDYGTIPFDELLDQIDEWTPTSYKIDSQQYVDVDGNGKNDCVLWLKPKDGGEQNRTDLCVLNLQDGKMYAYIVNYVNNCSVDEEGTFVVGGEFPYRFRLTFDKDDCLQYYMYD